MDSSILRIKSKPFPVADKAPKLPLQPHLLYSPLCLLIASHWASSLNLDETFFPGLEPLYCCNLCLGHPVSPRCAHDWPRLSLRLGSNMTSLARPFLGLPNQMSTSPLLYSLHSFIRFTALITTWNYFICLRSYWLSLPQGCIFQKNKGLSVMFTTVTSVPDTKFSKYLLQEWFLSLFHSQFTYAGPHTWLGALVFPALEW